MKKSIVSIIILLLLVSCNQKQNATENEANEIINVPPAVTAPVTQEAPETISSENTGSVTEEVTATETEVKNGEYTSKKGKKITVTGMGENNMLKAPPISLKGKVPANWISEGFFPVKLIDPSGNVLAQAGINANTADGFGNPITTDIEFTANFDFKLPGGGNAKLVLSASNPSGLPINDDSVEILVTFEEVKN